MPLTYVRGSEKSIPLLGKKLPPCRELMGNSDARPGPTLQRILFFLFAFFLFLLLLLFLFGFVENVLAELDLHVFFHLGVIYEVQLVIVVVAGQIAGFLGISAADLGAFVVDRALVILFGQVAALVYYVDVPVAILDENGDAFMCQIPANIVKIVPVFRVIDGVSKIAAAKAGAFCAHCFFETGCLFVSQGQNSIQVNSSCF